MGLGLLKLDHGRRWEEMVADSRIACNGADTYFWEDLWHGDMVLKERYPRLYALEVKKTVDVASKLSQENLTWSYLSCYEKCSRNKIRFPGSVYSTRCIEKAIPIRLTFMHGRYIFEDLPLVGMVDFMEVLIRSMIGFS
ncbi:hypothetical protein Tco_0393876 [Tanacetum coccineum]